MERCSIDEKKTPPDPIRLKNRVKLAHPSQGEILGAQNKIQFLILNSHQERKVTAARQVFQTSVMRALYSRETALFLL